MKLTQTLALALLIIAALLAPSGVEAKKLTIDGTGRYNGHIDRDGQPSGRGKMVYLNGDTYEGEWRDGKREGKGTLRTSSGVVYEGDWTGDDLRYGKVKYRTMGTYEGYLQGLKLHGYGVRRYPDGRIIEGRWNGDNREGIVKETAANGKVSHALYKNGVKTGLSVTTATRPKGIDISRYQSNILWPSLYFYEDGTEPDYRLNGATSGRVSPVEFVIIKATEGGDHRDPMMDRHTDNARRFNYPRGFYHFYNKTSSAEANAANYIANVRLEKTDLPPILDIEVEGVDVKDLLHWVKKIEKHYGRKPFIYTNEQFYKMYVKGTGLEKYPLWYSRFGRKDIDRGASLFQFTESGKLDGVIGHTVDINVIPRGTLKDLIRL